MRYVAEQQITWDIFVQTLTHAYNTQIHRSTIVSSFSLVLSRHPPRVITFEVLLEILSDLPSNVSPRVLHNRIFQRLALTRENPDKRLTDGQKRHRYDYDTRVGQTADFKLQNKRDSIY